MSRGRRLVLEPGPLAHQPRRIASTIDRERPTISPEGSESNLVTASERSKFIRKANELTESKDPFLIPAPHRLREFSQSPRVDSASYFI